MPNTAQDVDFLIKCYLKDWKINDYAGPNFKKTEALVDQYNISIVSANDEDIGYFRILIDATNKHLGVELFLYSNKKRAIYWLLKAAILRVWNFGRWRYPDHHIEVNTWHPRITKWVQQLVPEIREHVIYDTYRILHCHMSELNHSTHEILDSYIKKASVPDFNLELN